MRIRYIFSTNPKETQLQSTTTQQRLHTGQSVFFGVKFGLTYSPNDKPRDLNTRTATVMEILSNPFCASGAALPNGSVITFGGNGAIGPGGNIGSVRNGAGSGAYDATYGDYDGTKAIRILNPCTSSQNINSSGCQWYDNPQTLSMQKQRWYSTAETLPDGSVVMIGGFVNGGYVNRNLPNTDPTFEGGAAEPTYEFYPSKGPATQMAFLTKTSGLNAYALTWTLASGQLFVQANLSTSCVIRFSFCYFR